MNTDKYQQALHACALTPDLKVLSGGDQTEIGEKVREVNCTGQYWENRHEINYELHTHHSLIIVIF